jgi:hypothetical protein
MKEKYSNIKKCPWCGVKPTLTIAPHGNTIMFDITLGCTNEKCRFNPKCYSSTTVNGIDGFISEMIAEWNVRSGGKVPDPPKIEIVTDTESKWVLSEPDKNEEVITDLKCVFCKHWYLDGNNYAWCKRHAARTVNALKECRYKDFIDKTGETTDAETEHKCADCESFDTKNNTCLLKEDSCPNGCDCFRRVCSDCKNYWYCAGEECCNLDKPSFPEPCDEFEREGSE